MLYSIRVWHCGIYIEDHPHENSTPPRPDNPTVGFVGTLLTVWTNEHDGNTFPSRPTVRLSGWHEIVTQANLAALGRPHLRRRYWARPTVASNMHVMVAVRQTPNQKRRPCSPNRPNISAEQQQLACLVVLSRKQKTRENKTKKIGSASRWLPWLVSTILARALFSPRQAAKKGIADARDRARCTFVSPVPDEEPKK